MWTAAAVLLTTGLNLAGVKVAARAATIVVVVETVVLAAVLVGGLMVLAQHGPQRPWLSPLLGVGGLSAAAVLGAVSIAVLSFLGFDALATFAEETVGGRHIVGRATIICLVVAGLLFAAQTYVGALLMPHTPAELGADPTLQGPAYYSMVGGQIAPWLQVSLAIAKGAGAAFSAMVGQAAASRVLLDMGREAALPHILTKVSRRTGVPMTGILVTAAGNVALAVWAATQEDGLDVLVSIVDVGALVAFTLLHAAVIGYFLVKRLGGTPSPVRHGVAPALGALILVVVLASASRLALIVGLVWLALGAVVAVVRHRRAQVTPV